MLTTVLLMLLFLAVIVLGFLVWKKLPQLRIVNPDSDKDVQAKKLKYEIMRQRVERAGGKQIDKISSGVIKPVGVGIQTIFRKMAGKLVAVERRYQEKQKVGAGGKLDRETAKRLIEEGKKLTDEEAWERAEKKFIEVISSDPKDSEAYENLGRLYLMKKDFKLAQETFAFLVKLNPKDASVIASLGEVEEKLGNIKKAQTQFKRAVKISPKNPKYLDFLISTTIEVGEKNEAMSTLDRLRRVNPENKKIDIFEKRISEMTVNK
ncbi:hypothetical protein COY25_03300 [Candidatus Uhrbacteria bacterium CG_4_10_14_0_2_um_filter_41_7]|uniref:Uncharacterized protein n=1 Tax=Candidatus Uhrbacteria bacterium CG_4_9_14_3_um_filter_41_35 TaxID=1975034 RepID=A0A2M7XD58_9BACT|nr:MAG: hypothetical protein COV92_04155 [Candidatus Uhrbacteria bacterium CG11_big_fil_rev_8_21_14_0_20_41_9]PIZ53586.1 MAG: hypothetical protein COY25_03300 [Candidatus Uhrbacteria bacterium CG_4_10_14_0_2_um_filter_41_7]PJA45817.1 MAG: hypothetical protein CO173_04575 [Candidatus Uhrbacteria bacterium CG_4_9_14_3_um_filter_41_35]